MAWSTAGQPVPGESQLSPTSSAQYENRLCVCLCFVVFFLALLNSHLTPVFPQQSSPVNAVKTVEEYQINFPTGAENFLIQPPKLVNGMYFLNVKLPPASRHLQKYTNDTKSFTLFLVRSVKNFALRYPTSSLGPAHFASGATVLIPFIVH